MTSSNPLIIPGPGGDDYRDVVAAAQRLGVKVSTLRSHQYQDRNRAWPQGSEPWPQPVPEDDVVIEMPDGAGLGWAYVIDELMRRAGGAGRAVRLWRTSDLDAFLDRRDGDSMITGAEAQALMVEAVEVTGVGEPGSGSLRAFVELEEGRVEIEPIPADQAILCGESFTDSEGNSYRRAAVEIGGAVRRGFGGPEIGEITGSRETDRGIEVDMRIDDPEVWELIAPPLDGISVQVPSPDKPLTAKEVLERARLRREGNI